MAVHERVLLRPTDASPLSESRLAKVMERVMVMEKLMVEQDLERVH
jgi:hypothetical protein